MIDIPRVQQGNLEHNLGKTSRTISDDMFIDALMVAACNGRFEIVLSSNSRKPVFDCSTINCSTCMFKSKESFLRGLLRHMGEYDEDT